MKQAGIISDEEMEKEKAKILAKGDQNGKQVSRLTQHLAFQKAYALAAATHPHASLDDGLFRSGDAVRIDGKSAVHLPTKVRLQFMHLYNHASPHVCLQASVHAHHPIIYFTRTRV